MAETKYLPYARQSVGEDDIAAVADALRSDWLTTGPKVAAFEAAFARAVDAPFAVACSSGTAALHLAALALDLKPGDAVVVPAITFLATANAARFAGAEVVFADVDPETGLMEAGQLERALAGGGARVRAVFPVHLAGRVADGAAIAAVARKHGLKIVEDACHALGGTYGGHPVGACRHADMATFSFHPVKTVAAGEGGMITTRDKTLADRLALLRNHGMTRATAAFTDRDLALDDDGSANPWYYEMAEPGFNYRLSDIHCALGLSQLGKLDRFVAARRALVRRYRDRVAPLAPDVRMQPAPAGGEPAWHLAVALIDFAARGTSRARVMRALHESGIGTQVHYIPVHLQPYYRARYGAVELPGAMRYYRRCLSLPLFVGMTAADVDRVVDALAATLGLRAPMAAAAQ